MLFSPEGHTQGRHRLLSTTQSYESKQPHYLNPRRARQAVPCFIRLSRSWWRRNDLSPFLGGTGESKTAREKEEDPHVQICVVVFLSHVASGAGGTTITKKMDSEGLSFLGLLKLDITAVGGATDLQGRDILVKLQGYWLTDRSGPATDKQVMTTYCLSSLSSLIFPRPGSRGLGVPFRTALAVPCSQHSDKLGVSALTFAHY